MEQDRDGSAPADYSAALRAGDHSERAAQLDGLTPAGQSAGAKPSRSSSTATDSSAERTHSTAYATFGETGDAKHGSTRKPACQE